MEARGKQAAQFFAQLRTQVIGLFAAFTAGRGLKEFIADVTAIDAETGRLARTLDTTTETLSTWRGIAVLAGGSAAAMSGSIQGLVSQFQTFSLTGESSVIPYFRALGVQIADVNGRMRPTGDILLDLADQFQKLDPARAAAFGRAIGLDQTTINLLIQGRKAVQAMIDEQKRLGVVTKQDAEAGILLQHSWGALQQSSTSLGRTLLTETTPIIVRVLDALTSLAVWARAHGPFIEALFTGLAAVAVGFAAALLLPFAPILALVGAIGLAVGAIALLYDDWKVWTEGGKAAFGGFWQFFADSWHAVPGIVGPAIDSINNYLAGIKSPEDALAHVISAFQALNDALLGIGKSIFFGFISDFRAFIAEIPTLGPDLLNAFKAAFTNPVDWLKSKFDILPDFIKKRLSTGGADATPAKPAPAPGTVGSAAQAEGDIAKLVSLGWTREQATGIVANTQRESGGNIRAVGDSGKAVGLAQWHPDRQAAFARWAGHDLSTSTRDEQIEFINYELRRGSEQRAGAALSRVTDAGSAAAIVSKLYERPADQAGEASTRSSIALALQARGGVPAGLAVGAPAAAAGSSYAYNQPSSSTSTAETNIGAVNVYTRATDADGIARDIKPAIQRNAFAAQSNYGPS